jgi:hypothetical protein
MGTRVAHGLGVEPRTPDTEDRMPMRSRKHRRIHMAGSRAIPRRRRSGHTSPRGSPATGQVPRVRVASSTTFTARIRRRQSPLVSVSNHTLDHRDEENCPTRDEHPARKCRPLPSWNQQESDPDRCR